MKKGLLFSCFLYLFLSFHAERAFGSHSAGGVLTYQWLHDNVYRLTVTFYRDCSGVLEPAKMEIDFTSGCYPFSVDSIHFYAVKQAPTTGTEIGYPCPGATTCASGTNPGYKKYVYQVDADLGSHYCSDWVMNFIDWDHSNVLARNSGITTLVNPGSTFLYTATTLDNLNAAGNSSVSFSNDPILYTCVGQPLVFNLGATDTDGDSLYYEFIAAKSTATNTISYKATLSPTDPLFPAGSVSIDHATGDVNISTSTQQVGVITIRIREYRNRTQVGSAVIDMQIVIQSCSNNYPTLSGINNTIVYLDTVCAGSTINFTVSSSDIDPSDVVSMSWNNELSSPASFSSNGALRPIGTFNWLTTAADASTSPYIFTVTVHDNACPSHGFQTHSYSIYVLNPALASAVGATICNGQAATLTASGGDSYLWSPGGAITSSISVSPAVTTNYSVTVAATGSCTTTAIATVNVNSAPTRPVITHSANWDTLYASPAIYSTYQWYKNSISMPGANSDTLVIDSDPSRYNVIVSNASNCSDSALFYQTRLLPVELLSFDAIYNGRKADIFWSTVSEINNDYFTVERTKDGLDFTPVTQVKGAGNSTTLLTYHVDDENPLTGFSAYRLKQTDFDGQFIYSKLVALNINEQIQPEVKLITSAMNIIQYLVSASGNLSHLEIMDGVGKTIYSKTTSENSGAIDFSGFAHGVYLFKVFDNSGVAVKRFVY